MGGSIEAEDLKWLSDKDFVDATVSFSTCLYTIQIFNENKAEVDSLFERLVSLTEVNSLMTRLTGLANSRAAAHESSTGLLLELEKKQQELEIRFKGLVKAAEKALARETQHADSVFSREEEPSGKDGGGSSSSFGSSIPDDIGGQRMKLPESAMSSTCQKRPASQFGGALDNDRVPCLRYQGKHLSRKRCKKGNGCPFLHVNQDQELTLAQNRLHAPFSHLTRDNNILKVPPLMQAVKCWWRHTMQQETDCPITAMDVLREGNSLVVLLTLSKDLPSRLAQDSSAKSSFTTEDGTQINGSTAEIPHDRTWWHGTVMECFGDILRDSLCTGHQGTWKGVYSFTSWEKCVAYGGQVYFGFRSEGMVTRLSGKCSVPEYIPEGVIGYFDSCNKRQWIHHPRNVQLTQARVDYDTLRTFFAEAYEKNPDGYRYDIDAAHADRLPSSAQRSRGEPVPPAPAQSAPPPSLSSSSSSVLVHAPSAIESPLASTGGTEVAIESSLASTGGTEEARCYYHKSSEGCSGPVVCWIWMTSKSARPKARNVCASHHK